MLHLPQESDKPSENQLQDEITSMIRRIQFASSAKEIDVILPLGAKENLRYGDEIKKYMSELFSRIDVLPTELKKTSDNFHHEYISVGVDYIRQLTMDLEHEVTDIFQEMFLVNTARKVANNMPFDEAITTTLDACVKTGKEFIKHMYRSSDLSDDNFLHDHIFYPLCFYRVTGFFALFSPLTSLVYAKEKRTVQQEAIKEVEQYKPYLKTLFTWEANTAIKQDITNICQFLKEIIPPQYEGAQQEQMDQWSAGLQRLYPGKLPYKGYREAFLMHKKYRYLRDFHRSIFPYTESLQSILSTSSILPQVQKKFSLFGQTFLVYIDHGLTESLREEYTDSEVFPAQIGINILNITDCSPESIRERQKQLQKSNAKDAQADNTLRIVLDRYSGQIVPHQSFYTMSNLHESTCIMIPNISLYADHIEGGVETLYEILHETLKILTEEFLELADFQNFEDLYNIAYQTETHDPEQSSEEAEDIEEIDEEEGNDHGMESIFIEETERYQANQYEQPHHIEAQQLDENEEERTLLRANNLLYDAENSQMYVLQQLHNDTEPTMDAEELYTELTKEPLPEGRTLSHLRLTSKRPAITWPEVISILRRYFNVQEQRNSKSSHHRYTRKVGNMKRKTSLLHKKETAMIGTLQRVLRNLGIPEALFWIMYSQKSVLKRHGVQVQDIQALCDEYAQKIEQSMHGTR